MPILIDGSQFLISSLMSQIKFQKDVSEDMIRHILLNSIRMYRAKFVKEYGEVVICMDNKDHWRKDVFKHYKANRKKVIADSELNWKDIFDCMNKIRSELKEYFPYRVIDVESAEADDIIATMVDKFGSPLNTGEKILILSGDKDFIQLHVYGNVSQYDPVRKKWINHDDPAMFLNEHILKGDSGDGIPNVLSVSDCFVRDLRQKPLTKGTKEKLMAENAEDWTDYNAYGGYTRNRMLIDLTYIPSEIQEKIINTYEEVKPATKQKMLNYFMEHKLKNLMDVIEEF